MSGPHPDIGDVLLFSAFTGVAGKQIVGDDDLWGIVDGLDDNSMAGAASGDVHMLLGADERHRHWPFNENDEWTIPPASTWPDELCVALARRALVNEGN